MLRNIVLVVLAIPLVYFGLMMGASEFAEEVVVLRTFDADDKIFETSLWIVEDKRGALWLRAGMPGSGWVERIQGNPDVELVRNGATTLRTAQLVPESRDKVHAMMRERYGWADQIISGLRDGSGAVGVRLDERARPR